MAKVLLKFLILIIIELRNEISSSEDEFHLTWLNKEVISIERELYIHNQTVSSFLDNKF